VKRLPRVEIKMAVLAVISKRSKGRDRTIAAASLREIKNDLKKNYLKDVTERQVLNVIRDLGKLVVKEKDPRDRRRTLYRINPSVVEEAHSSSWTIRKPMDTIVTKESSTSIIP
jgi:hypothetical protein